MNANEFLAELRLILTDFNLEISISGSIYGTKKVPTRHFIDGKKNEVRSLGLRNIFISPLMGTAEKPFHYCTVYTLVSVRGYRRRTWYDDEYHKQFISANGYSLLLEKIKGMVNEIND